MMMDLPEEEEEDLVPPNNFALVCCGVYRAAFPKKKNFPFLKKLGLRSILTLILEDYPEPNVKFLQENNIQLLQHGMPGNKEPFVDIPEEKIRDALTALLDVRNHPILIHCNKGKHRTGCLVGCLRKFQHWSYTPIFDEYRLFAQPKVRSMDQQFVELFDVRKIKYDPKFLPDWPEIRLTWNRDALPSPAVLVAASQEDGPASSDSITSLTEGPLSATSSTTSSGRTHH